MPRTKAKKAKKESVAYSRKRRTRRPKVREGAEAYRLEAEPAVVQAATAARDKEKLGYNPLYETKPFTDFASVSPATDLSILNLNWREQDLPEAERTKHVHRLHPYLGKFIPQLVEIFLRKFQPETVCDPFCGCGTTLVEAKTMV